MGMVLYAVYADCDPITAGQVKKKDQVRVNQLYGRAVETETNYMVLLLKEEV